MCDIKYMLQVSTKLVLVSWSKLLHYVIMYVLIRHRLQTKLKYSTLYTSSSDNSQHTNKLEKLQENVLVLELTERQLRRRVDKLHEQELLLMDKITILNLEQFQQRHQENFERIPYTSFQSGIKTMICS